MANKFGKFLLCTAAIGTAAAAAYYYFSKKDSDLSMLHEVDDDYDDFSDDLDDDTDTSSRSYVALNREGTTAEDITSESINAVESNNPSETTDTSSFTPLAEQLVQPTEENTEETIEEFFDEDEEDSEEELPLQDME